jgi:hypothetical protein
VRYLLDEDVHPGVAPMTRGWELDVLSVHECDRRGLSDEDQFRFAASEGRVLATRNRDDFIRLVRTAYAAGEPCAGVLVVPFSLPNRDAARIAHALRRWHEARWRRGSAEDCFVDFLSSG